VDNQELRWFYLRQLAKKYQGILPQSLQASAGRAHPQPSCQPTDV